MTLNNLLKTFTTGITWNALLFVFYKIAATVLTFSLFYALSAGDFSTWANTNSLIFLTLLWLDLGLRKSIPLYAPFFAKNHASYRLFLAGLVAFQLVLLSCTLPLFLFGAQRLENLFQLPIQGSFLPLIALIFFTEGCVALLRLLFHAHFWIKEFNTLVMMIAGGELASDLFIIYIPRLPSPLIVQGIFIIKSIASLVLLICGIKKFSSLYKALGVSIDTTISIHKTLPSFAIHSLVMGGYTNIKSLTERNFLVPFFTYTLGTIPANAFKLANDAALLFYRAILKTIGTTDTALLAHAQLLSERKTALNDAFKKLLTQILWLCLPLLALVALLFFIKERLFVQATVMHAFFIMVLGYLLEALLSPYERLLEVKRKYLTIAIAYLPYCIGLLYAFTHTRELHLLSLLLLFHATRLTGSCILALVAKRMYHV